MQCLLSAHYIINSAICKTYDTFGRLAPLQRLRLRILSPSRSFALPVLRPPGPSPSRSFALPVLRPPGPSPSMAFALPVHRPRPPSAYCTPPPGRGGGWMELRAAGSLASVRTLSELNQRPELTENQMVSNLSGLSKYIYQRT